CIVALSGSRARARLEPILRRGENQGFHPGAGLAPPPPARRARPPPPARRPPRAPRRGDGPPAENPPPPPRAIPPPARRVSPPRGGVGPGHPSLRGQVRPAGGGAGDRPRARGADRHARRRVSEPALRRALRLRPLGRARGRRARAALGTGEDVKRFLPLFLLV